MLLVQLVVGNFPSYPAIGDWRRFNRILLADLKDLTDKKLPAEWHVDLACELIQACLQYEPDDR